jgi:hypothetical protein
VLLKTKFLHLLRTAPGVNWDTGLGLPVLAQQIAAGRNDACLHLQLLMLMINCIETPISFVQQAASS